jgi:hypothetical protein
METRFQTYNRLMQEWLSIPASVHAVCTGLEFAYQLGFISKKETTELAPKLLTNSFREVN